MNARPYGLAPVAFHLRHIARSLDRLLTYAEGLQLTGAQMDALKGELEPGRGRRCWRSLDGAEVRRSERIRRFRRASYDEVRGVGRKGLPSTWVGCWCIARSIRSGMWGRR